MKRGFRTVWHLSLFGMACVLLAGSTWPQHATSLPSLGDRAPLVTDLYGNRVAEASGAPGPASSGRRVHEPHWSPFATVGAVTLLHPASRVERVGFHESSHDGARQLDVHPSATNPVTMESRGRGTGSRSAADVVVDPEVEIRVPVSGKVVRSGGYALYCEYYDEYAVIAPQDQPGWEVKVLHIDGLRVEPGDRVEAGVTVLAARARSLPFRSQVDDHTEAPSWPHVHIEVIDSSIPDRPSSGGGC